MKGLLVLNGDKSEDISVLSCYDFTVVCDGAYEKAKSQLEKISVVVGDFDSLGYVPTDVKTKKLVPEKDFTDGEVGLRLLAENGCTEIDIVWAMGLRTDHMLGNLALLKIADDLGVKAKITSSVEDIYLTSGEFSLSGVLGKTISLLPFGESAHIIDGEGFKYKVNDLTLTKGSTLGISNVATDSSVKVKVDSGSLYVIVNKAER